MRVRGGRFYLRRHVPTDLQSIVGRKEVWRSLKTDSLQSALRRFPVALAALELKFEQFRHDAGLSVDQTLLKPCADNLAPTPYKQAEEAKETISLARAYSKYMADPTHRWSASTRQAYETTRRFAVGIIGMDVQIESLSRAHCRDYLEVLRHLPRNASKRFPSISLRAASHLVQKQNGLELISTANANAHLANFSSFLNWAVNEELIPRNPMRGLRLPDEVAKKDKRHPFSSEQLQTIFNAPLYRGCLDGERGYAKPGFERPRNARFWVPLIALHTGMRLNEICQLDTTDIREIEGVQCIVVSAHSLGEDGGKTLKTVTSERRIPLHPTLIKCGLIAYAKRKRGEKHSKLFHEIDPGSKGKRAIAFSKWFTQFSRACGSYRPRTSFHSFRHNFRDAMRAARIDHDIAMALGGWTTRSDLSVSENYGNGFPTMVLDEAVRSLNFAEIDLSHIVKT